MGYFAYLAVINKLNYVLSIPFMGYNTTDVSIRLFRNNFQFPLWDTVVIQHVI